MKKFKSEKGALMMATVLLAILGMAMGIYMYNSSKSTLNRSTIRDYDDDYYNSYYYDSYYNNTSSYSNYYNY